MLHVGDLRATTIFWDKVIPLFHINDATKAFRGKVTFLVYIHDKPQPRGIKVYVLSKSHSSYLHVIIYYGKETIYMYSRPKPHNKHCITLTAPLANKVTAKLTIAIPQEINILLLLILQTHFIV